MPVIIVRTVTSPYILPKYSTPSNERQSVAMGGTFPCRLKNMIYEFSSELMLRRRVWALWIDLERDVPDRIRCGINAARSLWANDMQANSKRDALEDHAGMNKVLIVEDDLIIALDLEDMVSGLGFEVSGLASSLEHALHLAPSSNIAFVDVNLSDGPSGPAIGRILAEDFGVTVVFMTGNAEAVADGVRGTLGVVSKPVSPKTVEETLNYVAARRNNEIASVPPMLKIFRA